MQSLILSSPRLQLSPFPMEELEHFHKMNTSPFVRQYLWDDEIITVELAAQILAQNAQHFEEDRYGLWKITHKETDAFIGYAGLWFFFEESQPQLIYALQADAAGNGYATEAAQLVIDYAFQALGFEYLIAATDEPHLASQSVAQRLGMLQNRIETLDGKATVFFRLEKK
ncbi:MAG: GNAT family N-acetyltransferase [Saprospiraceae bacterium]|nr:GNAT family N-acetyltransferase [Saprospiraceae bacterium]